MGKPGVLHFMRVQRARHQFATEQHDGISIICQYHIVLRISSIQPSNIMSEYYSNSNMFKVIGSIMFTVTLILIIKNRFKLNYSTKSKISNIIFITAMTLH